MAFPKKIFVAEKGPSYERYLEASKKQEDLVEDDGLVQVVAIYELVKTIRLKKVVQLA